MAAGSFNSDLMASGLPDAETIGSCQKEIAFSFNCTNKAAQTFGEAIKLRGVLVSQLDFAHGAHALQGRREMMAMQNLHSGSV